MPVLRSSDRVAGVRARGEAAFLRAAEELVAEGTRYADVSIAELARRAGFSRASFYAYFPDKLALAVAVGERFREALEDDVGRWLEGDDPSTLREVLRRAVATFEEHRGAVLLMAEAAAYDTDISEFRRALHGTFEARVRERLARNDPAADPGQAEAQAFALVWGTQAAIIEHMTTGRFDTERLVDALTVLWDAGLRVSR
jgi:TetR/AcrR family transcriptional regulator, ethionamide resistance regulator